MNLNLTKKIALLNKLSGETLGMIFFTDWELSSYGKNSLFNSHSGCIGIVRASDLVECINKAYRLVGEKMANE